MRAALLFFLIMIGVSFSPSAAKAQDLDQLHEKIKQNWAFPDCGTIRESAVFTGHFFVKYGSDGLTLQPYDILSGGKDYRLLARGKETYASRIENDGILKIGRMAGGNATKRTSWDDYDFEHVEEYTACAKPSKSFPKAIIRLMRYLDRIQEQCTVSLENDCARVLFKLADENNDQVIDRAEIGKSVMTTLLLAELADKGTLTPQDMKDIAARTKTESPAFADAALVQLDKNGSNNLDYNEVLATFVAPHGSFLKDAMKKIGKLMPAFGVAALRVDE